jgi:DNA-binding transcriptional ArsR family regulator
MFTEDTPLLKAKVVTSAPSLACDLSWLLSVAARPSMQARYPQLVEMFNGREDLADRVRSFWGELPEEMCFTEMQVLAHHAGALGETDPDTLWQSLEDAVATVPLDPDMPSESPLELATYRERFARLKQSPALVREYLDLLREVWEPVDAMWQQALPVIDEAGRHMVARYERGGSLETLLTPGCDILEKRRPFIVANVEAGQPLLVVPCLFFGTSMYLEFPDLVVIGTGVGQGDVLARAKTESVARRLKALADPTRLALLHSLAATPSTVGELAQFFHLAQPTVSMHVKVLRQSGLVQGEREGGRLRLSADPAAVEDLLGDLRLAVLHDQRPSLTPPFATSFPAGTRSSRSGRSTHSPGASTTGSERIPATVVERTRSAGPTTS